MSIRTFVDIGIIVGGNVQNELDSQSKITESFDALLAMDPRKSALYLFLK